MRWRAVRCGSPTSFRKLLDRVENPYKTLLECSSNGAGCLLGLSRDQLSRDGDVAVQQGHPAYRRKQANEISVRQSAVNGTGLPSHVVAVENYLGG